MHNPDFDEKLAQVGAYLDQLLERVPHSKINMNVASPVRSICEVLREINDLALQSNNTHLSDLAKEATIMAKKMTVKILEYDPRFKYNCNKELEAGKNGNYLDSLALRKGRK